MYAYVSCLHIRNKEGTREIVIQSSNLHFCKCDCQCNVASLFSVLKSTLLVLEYVLQWCIGFMVGSESDMFDGLYMQKELTVLQQETPLAEQNLLVCQRMKLRNCS